MAQISHKDRIEGYAQEMNEFSVWEIMQKYKTENLRNIPTLDSISNYLRAIKNLEIIDKENEGMRGVWGWVD